MSHKTPAPLPNQKQAYNHMLKYLSKRNTTRGNGIVRSHDQEQSKLNSTINAESDSHKLTHDGQWFS